MKRLLFVLIFIATGSFAQNLREVNFKYWYDPDAPTLRMRPVRNTSSWDIYFELRLRDSTRSASPADISWDLRKSVSEREGVAVNTDAVTITKSTLSGVRGVVRIPVGQDIVYLVASVTTSGAEKPFIYFTGLEPNFPETNPLLINGDPVVNKYVKTNSSLTIPADGSYYVSRYDDTFPTAPLPFSEALGKVSKGMKVDSTFVVSGNVDFSLSAGLYLIQRDTLAPEGVAIRAEDDYPRYSKLRNVGGPLIYICTSQEYERIRQAGGDKPAFDKVILSITKDAERAKTLMRSYFRRVEYANEFFTSYKEGWKTDRGMIYIIFGLPDEVYRSGERESWTYRNSQYKVTFDFARSPSLFDPNNFVLLRERKYKDIWYEVIDLWRNARF